MPESDSVRQFATLLSVSDFVFRAQQMRAPTFPSSSKELSSRVKKTVSGKEDSLPDPTNLEPTASHSTVTDFARFLGLSTSVPRASAA